MQKKLREIEGVILVKDDWGAKTPKIKINVDEQSASRHGITNESVAKSLQKVQFHFFPSLQLSAAIRQPWPQ